LSNGIVERRGYDELNRLNSLTNTNANGTILSNYNYTFDKAGNRKIVTELSGRKVEFFYDDIHRLTKETISDVANGNNIIEYTYDDAGNRLTRNDAIKGLTTYVYDGNDRLQSETSAGVITTYTYDNNGNVIKALNTERQVIYSWNAENRLIGTNITNLAGETKQIQYKYNANGIRVASIVNGEETRYLIDANRYYPQVLAEYKPTGEVLADYTYGARLLSQTHDGESSFYVYDEHSGVRQLTNELGQITDTYNYDAYGRLINSTGNTENSYLYRGEQFDSNIDLQYLRARYYDTNSGRFASVDPFEGLLEQPMSRHRYIYGNNNPVTYVDPSGEYSATALASDSLVASVWRMVETLSNAALPGRLLAITSGLAVTFGAITAATVGYSYWRKRSGRGVLWTGDFNLAKIPSYGAPPGTPSAAFGLAELLSKGEVAESATVSATGLSYSLLPQILPKLPVSLPTYSKYKVELQAPNVADAINTPGASNRGAFLGPFIFSTLKFTWPYILPDDTWDSSNFTEGVLVLGLGVGMIQKNSRTGNGSFYDGLTFSALDTSFAVGISVPGR
jgi:RHS repeat-associated protein